MQQVDRGLASRTRVRIAAAATLALGAALALAACSTTASTKSSPAAHTGSDSPASAAPSASASAAPAVISASPASGSTKLSPAQPITVSIAHGTLTSVVMRNSAGHAVHGALGAGGTSWHNTEKLGYDSTYTVRAIGHNADGAPVAQTQKFTTVTPSNKTMPTIEDIYGTALDNHATYGVGMVFRVHFDESVNRALAQRTLKVTTDPAATAASGSWYWDGNSDAYWRPKNYYAPGTKVTVTADVYGKRVGHGLYGQADAPAEHFTIGAKHVSIANAATHHVKVYFGDKLVRNMPTSMGMGGTTQGTDGPIYLWTMPGTYTVINHENPAIMSSASFGLPANSPLGYAPESVPWSTKISTDGIYLHELDATTWAQGHENVSHGCLNLNHDNAEWFYNHAKVGDIVKVVHSGGPKIQFYQGGEWSVPWSEWVKGSAL